MLLFSRPGLVKLLPALPGRWPTGQVAGLQSRCGVSVDIQWDLTAGTAGVGASHAESRPTGTLRANLTSREAQTVTIKLPFAPSKIDCSGGELSPSDLGDAYRQLPLPAGRLVVVSANK